VTIRDDIVVTQVLYDSAVTRVQRGTYRPASGNNAGTVTPVIVKATAQDVPGESLIRQYHTSYLAQNKVEHPAVSRVISAIDEGAGRVLILDDIGGVTLKQWIKTLQAGHARWPLEDPSVFHGLMLRLLRWSITLVEGIGACHAQNIIHNDINPANVVVNPDTDQIQLIDFGAAFPDGANIHEWTVVEQHRTLTYISPEQTGRLNRSIDYRSDYYALGATLYQLFSSVPPFVAQDLPELIHCHIARHPEPLDKLNPLIPESLSALVMKLMAKAPEERYQNGRCIIQDLTALEQALVSGIPFPLSALGQNDVPEQLMIPSRLYGREQELKILRDALNSSHDKPALVAVEGEAGGGKTTLITEVILHGLDAPGLLLAGKNDAYNKKPHNALSQALAKSVEMLLNLPERQFQTWRSALLDALSQNPHTLTALCPELSALFVGVEIPPRVPLVNADIQIKLHTSIFLQHLSNLEPLLLFIDDVQWSDAPGIALLEALINANHPHITVLVTCRSEEVDAAHPYSLMKQSLQDNAVATEIITLSNLGFSQISLLLNATFHINDDRLTELAKIVSRKTLGNPLFVHEFLKAAHHQRNSREKNINKPALYYDAQQGCWLWDKNQLKQIASSGNVAALLIDALHYQDPATQDLLQWAACIGTRFNETLLESVTQRSVADIKQQLNSVYSQGYIHRIADQQGNYAFNHDRIRQAYYELQTREKSQHRHWIIGQACAASAKNNEGFVDDPLPHFLAALRQEIPAAISEDDDVATDIINAFYDGAISARDKTANNIALQYVQCALRVVEAMAWHDTTQLSRLLLLEGELGYLTADIQLGGQAFDRYRAVNADVMLQAASFSQQAPLAYVRGDIDGSIHCSLSCFRLLGIDTPDFGGDITQALQFQREHFEMLGGFEKLAQRDIWKDVGEGGSPILQNTASTMCLLLRTKGQYQWGEWIGLVGTCDFLQFGFSDYTLQLLSLVDSLLLELKQHRFDQTIVNGTLDVAENNSRFFGAGFFFGNAGAYSGRYGRPMLDCLKLLERGGKISFDRGEYLPYVASASNRIVVGFSMGLPLQELSAIIAEHQRFMVSCGEFVTAGKYYSRLVNQLLGSNAVDDLNRSGFTQTQGDFLSHSAAFGIYHHLRLQNYFWRGQYALLAAYFLKEKTELANLPGMAPVDDNHFLYVIACLQCADNNDSMQVSIKHIEEIAQVCPPNFRHKALLIKAEQYRLDNDIRASDYYQQAAIDAKENGFIQMYALAHELHARYWQQQARPDLMQYHIVKAIQSYQRWGCAVKLDQLVNDFGQSLNYRESIFGNMESDNVVSGDAQSSGSPVSTARLMIQNVLPVNESQINVSQISVPGVSTPTAQNQKTLLKIANMVAEELDLKPRLSQIIQLAVENTHADGGVLLQGKNLQPKAIALSTGVYDVSQGIPFELPADAIACCVESKKAVMVAGLPSDNTGCHDVFLCYPVLYKGHCQSVILLMHSANKTGVKTADVKKAEFDRQ